jgi:hypothetical protein
MVRRIVLWETGGHQTPAQYEEYSRTARKELERLGQSINIKQLQYGFFVGNLKLIKPYIPLICKIFFGIPVGDSDLGRVSIVRETSNINGKPWRHTYTITRRST